MNCFNCEKERVCKSCLDLISQKETCFSDINMLKRQLLNKKHGMLPHYEAEYEPNQSIIDFEIAREILMTEVYKMVVRRGL